MAEYSLVADTGRRIGSRPSARLRAEGRVPAVVYGLGNDSVPCSVEWRELRAALTTAAGMNALIRLEVEDDKKLTIVRDLQRHPVRRDVLHVDFLEIDPDERIPVEVPVHLVGEAKAVLDENGVVDQLLFDLPVTAKPESIPNEFVVDVSELTLDEPIRAGDIELPTGVELDIEPDDAVVSGQITRSTIEAIEEEEFAEALEELDEAEAEAEAGVEGAERTEAGGGEEPEAEGGGGEGE